jgi:ribosomal protein L11 methyltransferase
MIEMMLGMDFKDKSVLDFGSGTGVLSILAHKMKAKSVIAIDIDQWAYNNIIENIRQNSAKTIKPVLGGAAEIPRRRYGVVLANVNKNILLENMEILLSGLIKNGEILFSGLLLPDEGAMVRSAQKNGLILREKKTKNEWLCLKFLKP